MIKLLRPSVQVILTLGFALASVSALAIGALGSTVPVSTPAIMGFSPETGGIGQIVTISGTNLHELRTLTLHGQALTFEALSDNELIAEIPVFAQSGKIEGTSVSGQPLVTIDKPFTVQTGFATVVLESVNPPAATIQSQIVIQGKNFAASGDVYFNGVRSPSVRREGLTKLIAEVPATATSGYIKVGQVTSTFQFEVIPNYCVPQSMAPAEFIIPSLVLGNVLYKKESPGHCDAFYDETDQVVEAVKGTMLSLYVEREVCGEGGHPDVSHLIYVDWNNDQDFYDANELMYSSIGEYSWDEWYQTFSVPATAPSSGNYRMRIYTTPYGSTHPCEFNKGYGVSIDLMLKMVDQYTVDQPEFTAFYPATTTYGNTVAVAGQFLQTTQRVYVGGIETGFSFNNQSGRLDIDIPPATTSSDVMIITQGGSLQLKDKLTIIPHPEIGMFTPELDTVGAKVEIRVPYGSGGSITHVFFNGVEAAYTHDDVSDLIVSTIPAGATSGKISVANQFGTYYASKDFTVIPAPVVTSFLPGSAHMGDYILINGNNFEAITGVFFNGMPTTFTVASSTQISAQVPYGGSHGKISVGNKNSTAVSNESLIVLPEETTATFGEIPSFNDHGLYTVGVNKFDYDGDGFIDLVICSALDRGGDGGTPDTIIIYRSHGDGTFSETDVRIYGSEFRIGDFNGDGRNDIVTKAGAGLRIYYNDNQGFKSPPYEISFLGLDLYQWNYTYPSLRALKDYDHDGDLDIILIGTLQTWLEQRNGTFTMQYIGIPNNYDGAIYFEDFNKDGTLDVTNNQVTRDFKTGIPIDYNADGYPDILGGFDANSYENLRLLENLKGNGFRQIVVGKPNVAYDPIAWGDFYNTGRTGVLSHTWDPRDPEFTSGKFTYNYYDLPASGAPVERESWESHSLLTVEGVPSWIPKLCFDFDNDGDLDMLTLFGGGRIWPRLFKNYTVERTGRVNQAPIPPTGLSVQPVSDTGTELLLKWNAASDDLTPVASLSYNVKVKDETTGILKLAPATLGTPYGNAGMMLQLYLKDFDHTHTYSFQVQAIDQGYKASAFSEPMTFKLDNLNVPTNLTATPTGLRAVTLQWVDHSATEKGYRVEFKPHDEDQFSLLTYVGQDTTQFNETLLDCQSTYDFRVQTYNEFATSGFSETATATTFGVSAEIKVSGTRLVASGGTTYTWYLNDELMPWTGNTITPVESGRYQVVATKQDCSARSEPVDFTITGMGEGHSRIVSITPNPTDGLFAVTTDHIHGQLTVMNSLGTEIYARTVVPSETSTVVDIRAQAPGLYVLSVRTDSTHEVYRLVLMK